MEKKDNKIQVNWYAQNDQDGRGLGAQGSGHSQSGQGAQGSGHSQSGQHGQGGQYDQARGHEQNGNAQGASNNKTDQDSNKDLNKDAGNQISNQANKQNGKKPNKQPNKRRIVLYVLLTAVILALVLGQIVPKAQQSMGGGDAEELTTSQFVAAVKDDRVKDVTYRAATAVLTGTYYKDAAAKKADKVTEFTSTYTGDDSLQELMAAHPKVNYNEDVSTSGWVSTLITTLLPILLFVGILIFFFSQMNGATNKQMQFGKAKIKKQGDDVPKVKFEDVAGIDEAVEELEEIRDFLSNPAKYQAMGAKIPRGVLLVGPPGTGKTLLARAVAGEAGVPFFSISGSDFVEMFVGVGASRVRDLFTQAKASSPSIIFIDEIDAVGRQRGAGVGGGHDEREQTLNQLLVEMDGFDVNDSVIMIAATNRVDILDPALLRPGRFDRQVIVDTPDLGGREKILEVHSKGKPLADAINLSAIAKMTVGFTGADLANLLNEAALLAARREKTIITNAELEESMERVIAGPERKGRVMTDAEKKCIAYHESGHALVGHLLEHADPVHKISIIARGQALGYTLSVPDEDRFLKSKNEMIDDLAVFLGGRVSEEIVIGDVTTGASNDLERATKMAKQMVTRYGMSDVLGHQVYGQANHEVFLGRDYGSTPDYSEQTASVIDSEVTRIMTDAHDTAFTILTENRAQLDLMASVLLERETVEGEAVEALLNNKWQEFLEKESAQKALEAKGGDGVAGGAAAGDGVAQGGGAVAAGDVLKGGAAAGDGVAQGGGADAGDVLNGDGAAADGGAAAADGGAAAADASVEGVAGAAPVSTDATTAGATGANAASTQAGANKAAQNTQNKDGKAAQ